MRRTWSPPKGTLTWSVATFDEGATKIIGRQRVPSRGSGDFLMPTVSGELESSRNPQTGMSASQTGAGAGEPNPGRVGGTGFGTSGRGVAALAPVGASTWAVGGGGVNLPVRTISST